MRRLEWAGKMGEKTVCYWDYVLFSNEKRFCSTYLTGMLRDGAMLAPICVGASVDSKGEGVLWSGAPYLREVPSNL